MPRYSVRFYTEYVDEYEVEAEDLLAAKALADAYTGDTDLIQQITKHAYVDFTGTCGCEIDEDGFYGESEDL